MRIQHQLNRWQRGLRKRLSRRGIILMYHAVAETAIDPWGIRVTPQHFAEQMQVLRQFATLLPLDEFAAAHRQGQLPRRAVAVTFDDGYANNLEQAKYWLDYYQIPATVFSISGYLGTTREFWWDELEQLLLTPGHLPESLTLDVAGQQHHWLLDESDYSKVAYDQDCHRTVEAAVPKSRLALYHSLWKVLLPLTETPRLHIFDNLWRWADRSPIQRPTHRVMRSEELHHLEQSGLITIGAHTVTHPFLSAHSPPIQLEEIQYSKKALENILGHSIQSFSYPFGNYQTETISLVQQAGFSHACTTRADVTWSGYDPWQLPRYAVQDWCGTDFLQHLRKWFW